MERTTPDLELYTIPSYSSWFSWINIHEVERFSLREFFDGSSATRTPRIYKEYRDFIISKYREDPSRRLSFTEVRKSLVGDISVLLKVFTFLEKWGLINFNVSDNGDKKHSYDGSAKAASEEDEESWRGRVKVEEGAPHGVRVVAAPNSIKPLVAPPPPPSVAVDGGGFVGEVGEGGFKWPPLASYSDVYGELMRQEKKCLVCGSCKESCDSAYYEYMKEERFILCEKCFKSGKYEDKSAEDFKLKDSVDQPAVWTEAETLLLLESVLKYGDDWDLVAKSVETKSILECISKLMQLPFGDLMLGAGYRKGRYLDVIGDVSNSKLVGSASSEPQEPMKADDSITELQKDQQNGDAKTEGPPLKRACTRPASDAMKLVGSASSESQEPMKADDSITELQKDQQYGDAKTEGPPPEIACTRPASDAGSSLMKLVGPASSESQEPMKADDSITKPQKDQQNGDAKTEGPPPERARTRPASDAGSSLMKQVNRISTMLGPQVTASAADAAITSLCYENQCSKELFDDDGYVDLKASPEASNQMRDADVDNAVEDKGPNQSETPGLSSVKSIIPLNLRTRAASAAALGAAAANAKLLADQEEREIGNLVANMIDAQVKKLQRKLKYFDDLEVIMEKEDAQLEQVEENLVAERLNVLQRIFSAGISKSKEHTPLSKVPN